jgi:hypothetical protein
VRNLVNRVDVPIAIEGDGPWTLLVSDLQTGATRGHMVPLVGGTGPLNAAMTVDAGSSPDASLETSAPVQLTSGSGASSVTVHLGQGVGPADPPGTYQISLVFSVVTGF